MHFGQKAELGRLTVFTGGAAGEVAADDGKLAHGRIKARFDVAAFGIKFFGVKTSDYIARFMAAVDAYAGVALFLRKVKNAAHACEGVKLALNIRSLGLDLLYANTIRAGCRNPCLHTFGRGRADAVEVEAG